MVKIYSIKQTHVNETKNTLINYSSIIRQQILLGFLSNNSLLLLFAVVMCYNL